MSILICVSVSKSGVRPEFSNSSPVIESSKNRGDKPIRVIRHVYMEVSGWNSLHNCLKQKCLFSKLKGECGGNIKYFCMKMEKWDFFETIPGKVGEKE
jgi:hypothetical protein